MLQSSEPVALRLQHALHAYTYLHVCGDSNDVVPGEMHACLYARFPYVFAAVCIA